MTVRDSARERTWTPLGRRLGITATPAQRQRILAAVERMKWTDNVSGAGWRFRQAPRAVVAAIFNGRLSQLRQVGQIEFGPGRQLIGLRDSYGTCSYVLEQDAPGSDSWLREAVFVLIETASAQLRADTA